MRKIFSLLLALTATATLTFAAPQSDSKAVNCGSTATLTATPKTGYHFVEWQKDGVQVSTSASYQVTAAAAATYKAIFALDTYTVTYEKGSAANASGTTVTDTKTYGQTLTLRSSASLFTRTGYKLAGWSTAEAGTSIAYELGGSYTNNAAITLYPYWQAETYTISYNKGANGTGTVAPTSKTYGVSTNLSSNTFTRTGYTQTGWSATDGGTKAYGLGAVYTEEGNATFYPFWTINTYTISYAPGANGSGTVASTSKTYGTNATLSSSTFTRTGYTQDGWSTTDGGARAYGLGATNYATEGNTTLYPHWVINTYTIHFYDDAGGSVIGDGTFSKDYEYNETVTAPVVGSDFPVKPATDQYTYTFAGWTPNVENKATANVDYVAQWDATLNSYTVTFKNWNGSILKSGDVDYGVAPTKPTDPTRTEVGKTYTFTGWSDGVNFYAKDATLPNVTGDVTYTAQYSETTLTYTVNVAVDAGSTGMGTVKVNSAGTSVTDNYGTNITITATPADACHQFVQWNDGDTNATRNITITGDITYTATFSVIKYTITATSDDDSQGTVTVTIP